jgi:purine nucleoside permease
VTPIPIKVVILAMYEPTPGDTVFTEGEMRRWVERLPLTDEMPFPFGGGALRLDPARGVLCMLTGVGNATAASAVTALGLHPAFDLTQAYWLMAGIAGADPARLSVGSACWVDWVVDGDLMHEIDRRDTPADWPTGRLPLGKSEPYAQPPKARSHNAAWRLDPGLVAWAHRLTERLTLADTPEVARFRAHFAASAPGAAPPVVTTGAVLGGSDFWHGPSMLAWARDWVGYWTEGAACFAVSAMEDAGIALALQALARAGRVDARRLLMLRTASNYVVPRPGLSAAQGLGSHKHEALCALKPSLENAFLVGNRVLEELLADWPRYRDRLPA